MHGSLRLSAAFAFTLSACAPTLEPASTLTSLRVLAVKKTTPYARPGDTVKLQMLFADGANIGVDASSRAVHVAWIPGCTNPPGDSYSACPASLASQASSKMGSAADGGLGPGGLLASARSLLTDKGPESSFTLPANIISEHKFQSAAQIPFGTEFVFFAACAGDGAHFEITAAENAFPLACYSKDGTPLGASDFVAGYTEEFAYDTDQAHGSHPIPAVTNNNPKVLAPAFELDGKPVDAECVGDACVALEEAESHAVRPAENASDGGPNSDAGTLGDSGDGARESVDAGVSRDAGDGGGGSTNPGSGAAAPVPACTADSSCIDRCLVPDQDNCPQHAVELMVDQSSAEKDLLLDPSGKVTEQMWIDYYTDEGKLIHDVKLLNDATTGWNAAHATSILAPQIAGPFHVWAVVHDNRGGVEWARLKINVGGSK